MIALCWQDINKKIESLNFNDCHAKIRQVDSQATVGSAVVVQVCTLTRLCLNVGVHACVREYREDKCLICFAFSALLHCCPY